MNRKVENPTLKEVPILRKQSNRKRILIGSKRRNMSLINLNDLPTKSPVAGFEGKITHTENQTIAFWKVKAGAFLPEHAHMHHQVVIITEGRLELTVAGTPILLNKGAVYTIPGNVPHESKAITDVIMTDIFYPVREDLKY